MVLFVAVAVAVALAGTPPSLPPPILAHAALHGKVVCLVHRVESRRLPKHLLLGQQHQTEKGAGLQCLLRDVRSAQAHHHQPFALGRLEDVKAELAAFRLQDGLLDLSEQLARPSYSFAPSSSLA